MRAAVLVLTMLVALSFLPAVAAYHEERCIGTICDDSAHGEPGNCATGPDGNSRTTIHAVLLVVSGYSFCSSEHDDQFRYTELMAGGIVGLVLLRWADHHDYSGNGTFVYALVLTPLGHHELEWAQDHETGECKTELRANSRPMQELGCPAGGPPTSPNPGYGHLLP